jgi:hypothetical protein
LSIVKEHLAILSEKTCITSLSKNVKLVMNVEFLMRSGKQIFCVSKIGKSSNLTFTESIAVFKEYNSAQLSKLK